MATSRNSDFLSLIRRWVKLWRPRGRVSSAAASLLSPPNLAPPLSPNPLSRPPARQCRDGGWRRPGSKQEKGDGGGGSRLPSTSHPVRQCRGGAVEAAGLEAGKRGRKGAVVPAVQRGNPLDKSRAADPRPRSVAHKDGAKFHLPLPSFESWQSLLQRQDGYISSPRLFSRDFLSHRVMCVDQKFILSRRGYSSCATAGKEGRKRYQKAIHQLSPPHEAVLGGVPAAVNRL